jgi:DNA polymerase-4
VIFFNFKLQPLEMKKTIIHLDLDSFFVSVERLRNSKLNKKPVIIGGLSDRGVVSACSYEAREFGVHSAMPMYVAKKLCPQATYIRGDMDLYSRYSRLVTEIIKDKAPLFEKASIDEHYIDISGMDRFIGSLKWSRELRDFIIKESGLPISLGISINKTVSKMATVEAKPNGFQDVQQAYVQKFLDPLSIRKIPMVGNKTYHLLRSMGVVRIQTLRQIPPQLMKNLMGKNGLVILKKANGIDQTPVIPYTERKSISTEQTFEKDTTDIAFLNMSLQKMTAHLAFRLRKEKKLVSTISVKIRYTNYDTHSLQKRIAYTSFDHVLKQQVLDLFKRLYTRRMLIRLIGIKFSGLVSGVQQLSMFDETSHQIDLYQAIDRIKLRYGEQSIGYAIYH